MTFYETMMKIMEKQGMTAADMCAKTGLYPSYFSKLKSGHIKDVTWDRAIIIIDALGITPSEFLRIQSGK